MAAAELGQLEPQRSEALSCAGPVERARALIPLLEAAGPAIEAGRQLTPEVLEALRANDFFRLLTARGIGGQALSLVTFAEICEALAIGDPSTAWCVNQGNVSSLTSSTYLAPEVGRSLFGGRDQALAWGAQHNQAAAVVVPGGFQVTGTWDFASGSRHATTLGAHVPVKLADGTPRIGVERQAGIRHRAVPPGGGADHRGLGLHGPARHRQRHLCAGRTCSCRTATPASATGWRAGRSTAPSPPSPPTSATPRASPPPRWAPPAACWTASWPWRAARPRGPGRRRWPRTTPSSPRSRSWRRSCAAPGCTCWARCGEAWAEAAATGGLSLDTRMAMRLATTSVMGEATEVSVACYRAAGTTAVLESQPFERRFRDAHLHLPAPPGDAGAPRDGGPPPAGRAAGGAIRLTPGGRRGLSLGGGLGYWDGAGPVAQLDRALPSEGKGRTFESYRVRHFFQWVRRQRPRLLEPPAGMVPRNLS